MLDERADAERRPNLLRETNASGANSDREKHFFLFSRPRARLATITVDVQFAISFDYKYVQLIICLCVCIHTYIHIYTASINSYLSFRRESLSGCMSVGGSFRRA